MGKKNPKLFLCQTFPAPSPPWDVPSRCQLENFCYRQAVDRGFSSQNAGLLLMIVASPLSKQIQASGAAHHKRQPRIGDGSGMLRKCTCGRNARRELGIGVHQAGRQADGWSQPVQIVDPRSKWLVQIFF